MKIHLISLFAGVLVGVIYGLINVRSPAPPVVALLGLLGMLMGEQAVPLARRMLAPDPVVTAVNEQAEPGSRTPADPARVPRDEGTDAAGPP